MVSSEFIFGQKLDLEHSVLKVVFWGHKEEPEIDAFTPRSSQGWSGEKWYPFSDNKSSTNATSIAPASRRARVKNFEKNEVGNAHWRDEGCCLSLPLVFKAFIHTEEPYDDHQDRLLFLNSLDYYLELLNNMSSATFWNVFVLTLEGAVQRYSKRDQK